MDAVSLLMLPLGAIITATWVIIAAALGREPMFRSPFLVAYALAILLMQPWHIGSWQDARHGSCDACHERHSDRSWMCCWWNTCRPGRLSPA